MKRDASNETRSGKNRAQPSQEEVVVEALARMAAAQEQQAAAASGLDSSFARIADAFEDIAGAMVAHVGMVEKALSVARAILPRSF